MSDVPYLNQQGYAGPPPSYSLMPPGAPVRPYWQAMVNERAPSLVSRKRPAEKEEDKITLGGKWTAEEEAYAAVLIQHFRTGALTDCENGTTLRSYLAEKLECIPMRISKKFAGIKIGKEIFRRGRTTPEVAMHLEYIRDLFLQSTSKKRKRIKRKLQKVANAAKAEEAESSSHAGEDVVVEPAAVVTPADSPALTDSAINNISSEV